MTETLLDEPLPPPPPDPRRLVRDPQDQVVAGVCAAFGRYTGTDPVLWRVAVAALALLGGAGIALYAFGWLLVPRTGQPESAGERALRRPDRSLRVVGVVGLGLVTVLLLGLTDGTAVAALAVLGGIAYLVWRERRQPAQTGTTGAQAPPPPPLPPREPSPLGGITLSAAVLVAGVLLVLRQAGADGVTVPRVLAAVLLVLGAGLVVGTWWGRARWLLPIGLVAALALGGSAAADQAVLAGGVGERTWRAVDGGSYQLGVGEAVLDLRGLRGAEDATVSVRVGLGQVVVLVPRGLTVEVDARTRLGEVSGDAAPFGVSDVGGERFVVGPSDDVDVTLDLEVGVGEIEVRHA